MIHKHNFFFIYLFLIERVYVYSAAMPHNYYFVCLLLFCLFFSVISTVQPGGNVSLSQCPQYINVQGKLYL